MFLLTQTLSIFGPFVFQDNTFTLLNENDYIGQMYNQINIR